jgi:hypothetical protein
MVTLAEASERAPDFEVAVYLQSGSKHVLGVAVQVQYCSGGGG